MTKLFQMLSLITLSFLNYTLLGTLNADAETIVSPQEFEKLSTGKTQYFERNGRFFGAEQFYTRRRTLWQTHDGECADGVWHARGSLICFDYIEQPETQCWYFIKKPTGYYARHENSGEEFDLFMFKSDEKPLDCKGPSVGA